MKLRRETEKQKDDKPLYQIRGAENNEEAAALKPDFKMNSDAERRAAPFRSKVHSRLDNIESIN